MDFQERESLRKRHMNLTVYIPMTLVEVIDRLADSREWSASQTLEHLIRTGLRAEAEAAKNGKAGV